MQLLNTQNALMALQSLEMHLTPVEYRDVRTVAQQLGENTHAVSVGQVLATLFPDTVHETATKRLSDFVKRFNQVAQSQQQAVKLELHGAKKLGDARQVRFVGNVSISGNAELLDLDRVGGNMIAQPRGKVLRPIVILTVNQHESRAVLDAFLGSEAHRQQERGGLLFDQLGIHGEFEVLHTSCEMGSGGIGAAQARAMEAIIHFSPYAVIAVGVAFGVNPEKQKIGDVLVSRQVQCYEPQRVGNKAQWRGDCATASDVLLQRSRAADNRNQRADPNWPKVEFGLMLSGEKLVDDIKFRDALVKLSAGTAIGGEMEGAGLYVSAQSKKVEWIVIKGICDWADGNKSEDKEARQQHAAANAAWVAKATIDPDCGLPARRPLEPRSGGMGIHDYKAIPYCLANQAVQTSLDKMAAMDARSAHGAAADGGQGEGKGLDALRYLHDWVRRESAAPLFALLGEYGMGKTVCCQRFVDELDQQRETQPSLPKPLYFDLRKLTALRTRVPTLDEILNECIERGWSRSAPVRPSAEQIHAQVAQGAVVVFDGLDEALVHMSEADGQSFTRELLRILPRIHPRGRALPGQSGQAASSASNSRVLISCRTQFFRTLREQQNHFTGQERENTGAEQFETLILLPLSEQQVLDYLAAAIPGNAPEQLMDLVRSVHNLDELSRRPYTLKLIGGMLPKIERWRAEGRRVFGVTLYREMVNSWLERDAGKHQLKPDHKLRLASHLAHTLWQQGQRLIPAAELESWFHTWCAGQADLAARYRDFHPDALEEDLRTATFLAREDGADESSSGFRFAHSSMQEFFLAQFLLEAVQKDRFADWALPMPSEETLDFLGQLLAEQGQPGLLKTMEGWCRTYRAQASEMLVVYAQLARGKGWPLPSLVGVDLRGAKLRERVFGTEDGGLGFWDWNGAQLQGADLHGARLRGMCLDRADFSGATLDFCEFLKGSCKDVAFDGCGMCGTLLREIDLAGASWNAVLDHHTQFLLCQSAPDTLPSAIVAPNECFLRGAALLIGGVGVKGRVVQWRFSADGTKLLAAEAARISLYDARSGMALLTFSVEQRGLRCCAISANGDMLAAAGEDGVVRLWSGSSGMACGELSGHRQDVLACEFNSDGSRLLSASRGWMNLWRTNDGGCLKTIGTEHWSCCTIATNGEQILAGTDVGHLKLWNESGELEMDIAASQYRVVDCAISADGRLVFALDEEGAASCWHVATGALARRWKAARCSRLHSAAFSDDGKQLLAWGMDNELTLYNCETGLALQLLTANGFPGCLCALASDGNQFLTYSAANEYIVWNAKSGMANYMFSKRARNPDLCGFSPDGEKVFISYWNVATFWDSHSGSLRLSSIHPDGITAGVFSDKGTKCRVLIHGGSLLEIGTELATVSRLAKIPIGYLFRATFSQDGKEIFITEYANRPSNIFDVATGEVSDMVHIIESEKIAFFEKIDGNWFLVSVRASKMSVKNVHSDAVPRCWPSPQQYICCGAITSDGKFALTGGADGTLCLWEVASGTLLRQIQGHAAEIFCCAISCDGSQLLSGGDDGAVRHWDARTGALLHTFLRYDNGHAVLAGNTILEASGDAWRDLAWQVPDGQGGVKFIPAESFGPLPPPRSAAAQACLPAPS